MAKENKTYFGSRMSKVLNLIDYIFNLWTKEWMTYKYGGAYHFEHQRSGIRIIVAEEIGYAKFGRRLRHLWERDQARRKGNEQKQ